MAEQKSEWRRRKGKNMNEVTEDRDERDEPPNAGEARREEQSQRIAKAIGCIAIALREQCDGLLQDLGFDDADIIELTYGMNESHREFARRYRNDCFSGDALKSIMDEFAVSSYGDDFRQLFNEFQRVTRV